MQLHAQRLAALLAIHDVAEAKKSHIDGPYDEESKDEAELHRNRVEIWLFLIIRDSVGTPYVILISQAY